MTLNFRISEQTWLELPPQCLQPGSQPSETLILGLSSSATMPSPADAEVEPGSVRRRGSPGRFCTQNRHELPARPGRPFAVTTAPRPGGLRGVSVPPSPITGDTRRSSVLDHAAPEPGAWSGATSLAPKSPPGPPSTGQRQKWAPIGEGGTLTPPRCPAQAPSRLSPIGEGGTLTPYRFRSESLRALIRNSTRRLLALPSSVLLVSMGCSSP